MTQASPTSILKVALPVPLPQLFDYLPPAEVIDIKAGSRVLVSFSGRKLVGVVCAVADETRIAKSRLQKVIRVLDEGKPLLNTELLDLLAWCWRYYRHAPGEVVQHALPPSLRKAAGQLPQPEQEYVLTATGTGRLTEPAGRARRQYELLNLLSAGAADADRLTRWSSTWRPLMRKLAEQGWVSTQSKQVSAAVPVPGPELTAEQKTVLTAVRSESAGFYCHLIDGVTGSGKTELYLSLIAGKITDGGQVLVLVPEIGLTPQLIRRFSERLGFEPSVYHSGMSDGARAATWAAAQRGTARLILGTRSALFLPLSEPALIIMDESHDSSFKQEDGFRFSARDVAVKRASGLNVPIILGTATPSLETLHNAIEGKYRWHRLTERATGACAPTWKIEDLRHQPIPGGLAPAVLDAMEQTLARGEQVLVFLNRRGYAPVLMCHECGWHASCNRCDANMTWHRSVQKLICHHCGAQHAVPRVCPDCAADALQGAGDGTQRMEQLLQKRFREYPLYRFDRDQTAQKGVFTEMVEAVRRNEPCILVGTQMLAKGHHFPSVTMVVVVGLDQALYSADFRATERMAQLLVQVAGRSGRADLPGTVWLQTHHPDHPGLMKLIGSGYGAFARDLLAERRLANLPPISFQACLRADAHGREPVQAFLQQALDGFSADGVNIYGPYPALMEKRGGRYRWYVLLQSQHRSRLQSALGSWLPQVRSLPAARQVRFAIDVDPQTF